VLNQTLDKFGQRWRALKPTDLKDWNPEEVAKVFTALDDWQAQVIMHISSSTMFCYSSVQTSTSSTHCMHTVYVSCAVSGAYEYARTLQKHLCMYVQLKHSIEQ
jgi:hypothetical protein